VAATGAESDLLQRFRGDISRISATADIGAEFDVLEGGEGRKEIEGLEDEADRAPTKGEQLGAGGSRDVLAEDFDFPFGGRVQRPDHVQQRRLSAPGGAEDDHELSGVDPEVDILQGGHDDVAHVVSTGDPRQLDEGRLSRVSGPGDQRFRRFQLLHPPIV